MRAAELADALYGQPNAEVLLKVGNDWVEVCGIKATGQHRNAVTFEVINPGVGGVIVREPEEEK